MSNKSIKIIKSSAYPLAIENVDTDQIIPSRFLKATTRDGFGQNLFRDWRYDSNGNLIPDFVLNDTAYSGEILVAGKNFGSGSSREHAAWALADFGFKAVVSSFLADIFTNNALNNFILPIIVPEPFLEQIFEEIKMDKTSIFEINLIDQTFKIMRTAESEKFDINPYKKMCLLNGFDDIDYLLAQKEQIDLYETKRPAFY